ncbi:MAG: hypothetical protein MOGMAGMI_02476 [Candidatus Omnitrophica bacterium]|nr:hypothetical protein [Candidatus Omnitrophota bacterium]
MAELLVTAAQIRAALARERTDIDAGMLDTASDGPLADLAAVVSAFIEGACDRVLVDIGTAQTWELEWDGSGYLDLHEIGAYPLTAITSVSIDGTAVDEADDHLSSGWWSNAHERAMGRIRVNGQSANLGDVVEVVARAGYTDDAATLRTAGTITYQEQRAHETALRELQTMAVDLAVYRFNHVVPGADVIEIGDLSMSFTERDIPRRVKAVLDRYRRLTF